MYFWAAVVGGGNGTRTRAVGNCTVGSPVNGRVGTTLNASADKLTGASDLAMPRAVFCLRLPLGWVCTFLSSLAALFFTYSCDFVVFLRRIPIIDLNCFFLRPYRHFPLGCFSRAFCRWLSFWATPSFCLPAPGAGFGLFSFSVFVFCHFLLLHFPMAVVVTYRVLRHFIQ